MSNASRWLRSGQRPARSRACPAPSIPDPATLLLHGCAHVSLHHSRALRLIWLVDVDRLARSEALDWDALSERSARWGLGLAAYTTLKTTAAWLGTPLPAAVMARLAQQADDPVLRAMWGLGDEVPGGARRRARATWTAFSGRQRLRYGAWMASRALARPFEAACAPRATRQRRQVKHHAPTGGVVK